MTSTDIESATESKCNTCSLSELCLPVGLSKAEVSTVASIVNREVSHSSKQRLFSQYDKFSCFYAVKMGAYKKYTITEDGREQIREFYLPGEFIGLDAVESGQYDCSVAAIVPSSVCEIPFDRLLTLASEIPRLQRQIIRLMSQRIRYSESILHNNSAEGSVAALLLNLITRYQRHDNTLMMIFLPMTRQEIANSLGLAIETVSRVFTRLKQDGIIETKGKSIKFTNLRKLQKLACH